MKKFKMLLLVAVFILMPVFVSAEDLTDEQLWTSFVKKFNETDLVKTATDGSLKISSTENALHIVLTDDDVPGSDSFSFTYSDGILTYVPSELKSKTFDNIADFNNAEYWFLLEDYLVQNCIQALADLKGYDDSFVSSLDLSQTGLSLEKNGIEYESKKYHYEGSDDNSTVTINIETFSKFKLDLRNGITLPTSTKQVKEEVVENPSTGIFTQYGIIAVAIIGLGTLGYVGIRKYSKFPQA